MELFKGQSLLEFTERFKTDLDCEEYLASLKWEDGYCCHKLRGIYSWVSEFNIDLYLAEYSFRINRLQNKDTIFNKLKENSISVCQSLKNGGIKPLMPNIIYQNVNMKAVVVRVINP